MLRIQALSKVYPNGFQALDAVSLEVNIGEVVALIGPSGAGKSTLIRCVNRLVEPSSGRILLGEQDLTLLGTSELRGLRRRIGMIFQSHGLVDRLTVMENVLSGRLGYVGFWQSLWRNFAPADVALAFETLARVGLEGLHDRRADALSGGQRQRVGIARALVQQPELLLVDEPTASLDPRSARQVMRLITELCRERGLAAIVNIHDVALARQFADRVVGLQAGRTVFSGTAAELTEDVLPHIYGAEGWELPKEGEEEEDGEEAPQALLGGAA